LNNRPDEKYFLRIKEGMAVESSRDDLEFRTTDVVDFSDPTDRGISIYQRDSITGETTFYLIKKVCTMYFSYNG